MNGYPKASPLGNVMTQNHFFCMRQKKRWEKPSRLSGVRFCLTASSFLCAQNGTKSQGLAPLGTYAPKTVSYVCADVMLRIGRMAGLLSLRLLSQTKLLCNFVCKISSDPSAPMRLSFALRKETVFEIQRKALTGPSVPPSIDRHAKSGHSLHLFPLPLMRTSTEVPAAHGRAPGAETCWQQACPVGLARYHDRQESGSGTQKSGASAYLNAGNKTLHHPILLSRNWGPRKTPAKRVLWGEDEQGSERNFCRQAEMEWSGLCEDEGVLRGQIIRARPSPA